MFLICWEPEPDSDATYEPIIVGEAAAARHVAAGNAFGANWREVCRGRLHPRGRWDFTALGIDGQNWFGQTGSLSMNGKVLGQNHVQSTARYARLARDSVKAASEQISGSLAADIDLAPDGGRDG